MGIATLKGSGCFGICRMAEELPPPFDRPDAYFNTLAGWTWVGTYGGWYLQSDLLQGFEQFTHRKVVESACLVGLLRAASRDHRDPVLAVQGGAPWPVGPAVGEDIIEPLLHQGRHRIPKKGMLEHQAVVLAEELLLLGDVDDSVWILAVGLIDGDL
jgi:hypothetical protein